MSKAIISKPSPEQETWLRNNYRMYSRYHLAKHLGIVDSVLSTWLKDLGLSSKHQINMSDEHKDFINDNFLKMTPEEIAVQLGLTVMKVKKFCARNGLNKIRHEYLASLNPKPVKKIIAFEPEVKPSRPRADHTNMSREQRIDYWLNYLI